MEKANNQLALRSEESLNLEEIALSGPITTNDQSKELLAYLKPETRELYQEVTSSRLLLPNIYEETQRIREGVKFHEKLEEISGTPCSLANQTNDIVRFLSFRTATFTRR